MRTITNDLEDVFLAGWSLMLGSFLVIVPWYLGFDGQAAPTWNAWACGSAILVLSLLALVQVNEWLEYATAAVGLWLCMAPWVLGFGDLIIPAGSHIGLGFALMIAAAAELWRLRHASGGRTG